MECDVVKKNLGLSRCNKLPKLPNGMIETPGNFVIPAATIASGPAAILTYLQSSLLAVEANRSYYWPPFDSYEDISEAAVYQDGPLSYRQVRDGNYRFRFGITQNMCLHKAMFTHRATSGRVILIDVENQLIGTELSNGDFAGLSIQMLNTEKLKFSDGSVATESPIVVALRNNKELDKNGAILDGTDIIGELYRIVDVELALVGDNTATLMTVDVSAICDGTAISGLVTADFLLVDNDDGATHAITSATESTTVPGRYAIVGVAFEASTLTLKAPSVLSVKAYESLAAIAIPAP